MKTEEFDDRIRQKVEAIDTPYTNAEVDAAFKYVKAKQAGFHFAKYTSHAAVAAVAACVASLIVWNIMLHKQNNEQQHTIAALNQHFYTVEKLLQDKKSDTVYVVQKNNMKMDAHGDEQNIVMPLETQIASNDDVQNPSSLAKSNNATDVAFSNSEKEGLKDANKAINSEIARKNQVAEAKKLQETEKNMFANNNTIYKEEHNENKTQNTKETAHETTNTIDNKNETTDLGNEKSKTDAQTSVTNVDAGNFAMQDSVAVDTYSGASVKTDSSTLQNTRLAPETKNTDSLAPVLPVDAQKVTDKKPARKPIAWGELFSNFDFRYGTIVEGGRRQAGLGLVGELFVTNRFSFTTGAKFTATHSENFMDDDDYMHRRGFSFNSSYQQSATNATNINMRTMLLQIPLYITYYHPLRNNYSLLFSAGTDLDLRAWQNVGYEQQQPFNRELHSFKTVVPTNIFNSVIVMAGLQKQWLVCALQLNPYIAIPTQTTAYKGDKIDGGLQLRLLFGGKNR